MRTVERTTVAGPEYEGTIIGIWLLPVGVLKCDRAAQAVERVL